MAATTGSSALRIRRAWRGPKQRLYSGYGLNWPYIIGPPWSSIVAYDLNRAPSGGSCRWETIRRPLLKGQEYRRLNETGNATALSSPRPGCCLSTRGMVKCGHSTPTMARCCGPRHFRPTREGIPAMYEVGGRQYLVIFRVRARFGVSAGAAAGGPPAEPLPLARASVALCVAHKNEGLSHVQKISCDGAHGGGLVCARHVSSGGRTVVPPGCHP